MRFSPVISGPKAEDSGMSCWRKQKFVTSWSPKVTTTKKGLNVSLFWYSDIKLRRLIAVRFLSGSKYWVYETDNDDNFCFFRVFV